MTDLLAALGVVFVAELGDKSQILALALASRHRPLPVLAGLAVVAVVLTGLAVAVGAALSAALPTGALAVGGGVLFLGFAAWTLLGDEDDHDEAVETGRSAFVSTVVAMSVAELGDKTMLAAAALAATANPWATWVGASTGMVAASAIAIAVGHAFGRRLPERPLRLASAGLFALFGVLLLVEGLA